MQPNCVQILVAVHNFFFPHSIKYHFPCGNPVVCPTPRATILPQFIICKFVLVNKPEFF